ncbi:zinc-dependent metalloprotease [Lacihabitans soyangensis]|nr:zinc-dependent metalloprotease [Lacihabitans soyangensis]
MILRRIFLFFGFTFILLSANGQTWCGVGNFSPEEKKTYLELLKNTKPSKKLRKGTAYEIYLKPKVIHNSKGSPSISTTQVFELINKINQDFLPINIQFIVDNNNIQHIVDDEYYDLKTENEGELRSKYDSNEGINIYFTHTITRPDLSQLNGYTSLPNLSQGSNNIVLSYLDNSPSHFSLLKEKIITHELGHYFGLLHTYQDSNHEDITKRELVTRSIGANCSTTGDMLCDTPADPFDRIPSIFSFGCNEKIPSEIRDFNGESYYPPVDNFMSYHHKCGFKFTPMQFQKMESGLNIRLSPLAEYKITKNVSNFLSVLNLDKNVYCKGENVIVDYQKTGSFDAKNQLKVEISDKNGENFREVSEFEVLSDKQIKVKVDQSWETGSNYRLIVKSTLPYSESPLSQNFEIKSYPTAEITSSQIKVNRGESFHLNVTFGGSGPWSFKDWDGFNYSNITSKSISFSIEADSNRLFSISEISNECGTLAQSPSVFIEVLQPSIKIESNGVFCNETLINMPLTGVRTTESADYYQLQIKHNSQTIIILPNLSQNSLQFYLPQEIQKDKTYALKIVGKKLGEFSNTISFIVKNPPAQPSIVTPLHVCYGAENYFLTAIGKNLKWYDEDNSKDFTFSVLLNTKQAYKKNYFVSQSDSNGCESLKSKLEVIVDDPVSAEISGSTSIFLGDSAFVQLNLKGSPPWNVSIDPLGDFNINTPEIKIAVNPLLTTEYRLKGISNYCGIGSVSGSASVVVQTILGNNPVENREIKVFPNPVTQEKVHFEASNERISKVLIYNIKGEILKTQWTKNQSSGDLDLSNIGTGKYCLKLIGTNKTYNYQIVK